MDAYELTVTWNGAKERAGEVPGLSRYQGQSALAPAIRQGSTLLAKGEYLDLRPNAPRETPRRKYHAIWCRTRSNSCLPCDCPKEA